MRILRSIDKAADKVFDRGILSLSNVLLFSIATVVFIEVITRYGFGISHGQAQEYCILFFTWLVLLMAGKVTKDKKHIVIEFLPDRLANAGKPRAKAIVDIYISLTFIIFGVMFLYFGVTDTILYEASGYRSVLPYVPYSWIRHLALPVGSAVLIYYGIKELIHNIRYFVQVSPKKEIEPR